MDGRSRFVDWIPLQMDGLQWLMDWLPGMVDGLPRRVDGLPRELFALPRSGAIAAAARCVLAIRADGRVVPAFIGQALRGDAAHDFRRRLADTVVLLRLGFESRDLPLVAVGLPRAGEHRQSARERPGRVGASRRIDPPVAGFAMAKEFASSPSRRRAISRATMNALKQLFGRDYRFYDLLDASAAEAQTSAELLLKLTTQFGMPEEEATIADIAQSRRRHKKHAQGITQELCKTFITPLEREDIEELSTSLYKVPKTVEKIAERMSICPAKFTHDIVVKQINLLAQATDAVKIMVGKLRNKLDIDKVMDTYDRLQTIEGDADKLMVGLLKELYQGSVETREVIVLKDLYELLERAIDRCRDAGNVVFRVVLKYS
jgi:uncharacterized protein